MKNFRKLLALMISVCCVAAAIPGVSVFADNTGEKVVTLGADLSAEQRTTMLKYFGIEGQDIETLTVTNADERALLSDFVSLDEIGTRTYSCALVKPTNSDGIQVKTANLTYVTSNMIASTLSTCGVENCQVLAAAPFAVSGTGALTGVVMAYESASGKQLNQKRVRAATRELITTARLGRRFGPPRATLLVNRAKIQVIQNKVTNVKDITNIINNVSIENNITLSDDELTLLSELLQDIAELDYDTEEIEEMEENLDRVEESLLTEIEQEEEDEDDILMNTDDSALGDDATFDSTEIMTLDLPRVEAEMEEESEEESEFEELTEEAAEEESEEESEKESEAQLEAESEMEEESEEEANTDNILFNTDDSILGDDVAVDLTMPENQEAEEPAEEVSEEAEEAEAETADEAAIPADPSAFLPEAETEEAAAEEITSLVLGEDMPEEESAPANEEAGETAEETAAEETNPDDIFDAIFEDDSSTSNETAETTAEDTGDDIFDSIFEDTDSFAEDTSSDSGSSAEAALDSSGSSSSSFTSSSLSFSPNGSSVDPDTSSLTISCSAGGLSAGSGSLTVYTSDGSQVVSVSMSDSSSVTVSSTSVSVSIGPVLAPNTSYYVILGSDALEKDGAALEATSSGSWSFSTSGSEGEADEEGDDWGDDWGDDDWDW